MQKVLFYGGPILTMDEVWMRPEAVLVQGDRIAAVGPLDTLKEKAPTAKMIDLKGCALLPGFIDSHSHFVSFANTLRYAGLSGCDSLQAIEQRLKQFVQQNQLAPGQVVVGFGYDNNDLPQRAHPTAKFLDEVLPGYPVVLCHASGHMGCVSSEVLKTLGITADTPDPQGGRIGKDESGMPSGYLEENAFMGAMGKVVPPDNTDPLELLKKAQDIYFKYGITTAQEGFLQQGNTQLLAAAAQAGVLKLDVVGYADLKGDADLPQRWPAFNGQYSGHFKIGGYKTFLDGSPQGRTAWLSQPYLNAEDGYCGYPTLSQQQINELVQQAAERNMQLLCHCNGDAAAQRFIDAHSQPSAQRNVMIHAQLLRPDQLPALKAAGIMPSYFVAHTWYWGDTHLYNLGRRRAESISPLADTAALEIPFTLHMDSPVLAPDCIDCVFCAVNRVTKSGESLAKGQQVSALEALKGVTGYAAWQYHEETSKGSITPGKQADLVVLSADPTAVPKEKLREVKVLATIKGGKAVYSLQV